MCLLIEALLPGCSTARAGEVTRAAASAGVLELRAQRQPRGAVGARFVITERGQGCACSLASDDADWDAPSWALRDDVVEPLARTLEFLVAQAGPAGLFVRAAWLTGAAAPLDVTDDPPVGASDLLRDVRQSRIANSRVYRIRGTVA